MAGRKFEKGVQIDSGLMGRLIGEWEAGAIDLRGNPEATVAALGIADPSLVGRLLEEWQAAMVDLRDNPKKTVTVLGTIVRSYRWGYLLSEHEVGRELGVSRDMVEAEEGPDSYKARMRVIGQTIDDLVSVSAILEERNGHPLAYLPSPTTMALLERSSVLTGATTAPVS